MKSNFYHLDITPHDRAQNALRIAPISATELESLWPLEPALRQTTNVEYQYYFDAAHLMYSELSKDGTVFGLYGEHNQSLIGFSALLDDPEPEVVHYITQEQSRAMGYGTLGKVGLAAFAFEVNDAPAVTARTLAINDMSIASLRKSGFSCVGRDASPAIYDNDKPPTDILHWRLQNPNHVSQSADAALATADMSGMRGYSQRRAGLSVCYAIDDMRIQL